MSLLLAALAFAPGLRAQPVSPDSSDALRDWRRGSEVAGEADGFDALPVRSVRGIAAWAPGLRGDLATGALTTRARLGAEPRFLVDGVRQLGGAALPFEAVRRVRVLTEGVPARYGDAALGLVLVDTDAEAGAPMVRLEAFSSRATDAYGTDLGALAVRAPLGRVGSAWVAGEAGRQDDASPYGVGAFQLTEDAYAALQQAPQAVAVTEAGQVRYLPFPTAAARAAFDAGRPLTADDLRRELGLAPGTSYEVISATEALDETAFERRAAKDDPLRDLRLAGGLSLRPAAGLAVRVDGRLDRQRAERSGSPVRQFQALPFNRDAVSDAQQDGAALMASLRHDLSPALGYRLWASTERRTFVSRPLGFSDRVEDALLYGDIDDPANEVARRYFVFRNLSSNAPPAFVPQYQRDSGSRPGPVLGTFDAPGRPLARYEKGEDGSLQAGGAVTVRLGTTRVEVGGEVEQQTHRRFALDGYGLAALVADADGPEQFVQGFPDGIRTYGDLPFEILRDRTATYGYTYNGLAAADDQDIDGYFSNASGARTNTDLAPYRPRTAAGYLDTETALGPLAVRVGVRVQGYDANTPVLLDPFSPVPIARVRDLEAAAPVGIGDDFAVYYNGAVVVGFRDLEGQFYDAQGSAVRLDDIITTQRGQVRSVSAPRSTAFRDAPVRVTVEPRVHVAFQASPVLRLSVSADRLSRRPDPSTFAPISAYEEVSGASTLGNPALRPEVTDALRLGAEVTPRPGLTVGVAGFARQSRDVPVVSVLLGGFPAYQTIRNGMELRETGLDLTADWRPSPALSVRGAYTLAVAEAAGQALPQAFAAPDPSYQTAPGDTRHALDVVLAARVPVSAGPRVAGVALVGGLGGGLVLRAQSGRPYSALGGRVFRVGDAFTGDLSGSVNGARLPWTHQLDLRLDKRIPVRGAAIEAFVWIENLLDVDNTLSVFRYTGEPGQDGYLGSEAGQAQYSTSGRRLMYQAYTSGAVTVGGVQSSAGDFVYGRPRQIRLGLRAAF